MEAVSRPVPFRARRPHPRVSPVAPVADVQGQNFIAAGLLRVLPEEQAFWMLAFVVESFLPEHYSELMTGSVVDCKVLAELLARRMPDVAAKLSALEVSVQLLATRWFLCFWSSILPPATLVRVYDVLFTIGPHATLLVALACFRVIRPSILAATNADELTLSAVMSPLEQASIAMCMCHVPCACACAYADELSACACAM